MYQNFYQLKKEPFNETPDPAFLFLSAGHKEALASIVYAVEKRKGLLAITGEVGLGKTTILRSYLKDIDRQRLKINYIFNANVSFKGLLKTIYEELGIHPETDDIFEMVNRLLLVLIEEYEKGHNFVLIIDDAQNLPFETLENLRMLSNLEASNDKLIQILLIGQPEFEKLLDQSNLRQLKQRITIRNTLSPLTQQESMAYIRHRLTKANAVSTTVFTKGALKLIVKKAKGVPRILNILCDNALITGYGYQQKPVTTRIVREVIADFEGKRKSPVLRWGIVTSTVFLILAGLFWLYPYKNLVLTELGSSVVSQTFQTSQIKKVPLPFMEESILESAKKTTTIQETINPDNSKTGQISLTNGRKEPSNEEEIQDQKKQTLPVSSIHKEGLVSLSMVKDEISEPSTNIVPLTTTVQVPTNSVNPSKYVNNANIAWIKESDLEYLPFSFERKQLGEATKSNQTSFDNDQLLNEESLDITNKTIDENYVVENPIAKLEKERTELEKLKSKFQERLNMRSIKREKEVDTKLP